MHEAVHVAIADRHAILIENTLLDMPAMTTCNALQEKAQQRAEALLKAHEAAQLAFDEQERERINKLILKQKPAS